MAKQAVLRAVQAQAGSRWDQGAVQTRRVWRELVGPAPGSRFWRASTSAQAFAGPVLCAGRAGAFDLLGEEFDRDPFLIFALRGLCRDALMARLGGNGAKPKGEATPPASCDRPAEPLSSDPETFWNSVGPQSGEPTSVVEIPRESAALIRRPGGFPFWRGESPFLETLSATYAAASIRGLNVYISGLWVVPIEGNRVRNDCAGDWMGRAFRVTIAGAPR